MDWHQLEYFCEVAKSEHMTKAAEKLHISQPSLSMAMRRLETELGVSLFERKGRNIALNAYGRVFLAKVEPALKLLEDGRQQLAAMAAESDNKISISTPSLYADPTLMERILGLYPKLMISQVHTTDVELERLLRENGLDFCITSLDLDADGLNCQVLRREKMMIIASRKHRLAKRDEVRFADCADEMFTTDIVGGSHRKCLETCSAAAGFEPKIGYVGTGIREIIEAVSLGFCIALLPEKAMVSDLHPDIKPIRVVDPCFYTELKLYWPQKKAERPLVASIRSILADFFSKVD